MKTVTVIEEMDNTATTTMDPVMVTTAIMIAMTRRAAGGMATAGT
jgi:hypothetical protein